MSILSHLELSRFHTPGGLLTVWPIAWGIGMAAYANSTPFNVVAMLLLKSLPGAFLMHAGMCVVNDIFDRKFDAAVERTKTRPIPSGRVSVFSATVYLFVQYAVVALYYATYGNSSVFWTAMIETVPMGIVYPLVKRVSYWPQAWLGIMLHIGFAQGWYQIDSTLPNYHAIGCVIVGATCWTISYDTVYGCQDKKDDLQVGVWSTAILFGKHVREIVSLFNVGIITFLYYAGLANNHGWRYFGISVGGTALLLTYQLATLDVESGKSCSNFFKSNAFYVGPLVLSGILLDYARLQ